MEPQNFETSLLTWLRASGTALALFLSTTTGPLTAAEITGTWACRFKEDPAVTLRLIQDSSELKGTIEYRHVGARVEIKKGTMQGSAFSFESRRPSKGPGGSVDVWKGVIKEGDSMTIKRYYYASAMGREAEVGPYECERIKE